MRPDRWLEVAGYVTWLVSGLPTALDIAAGDLTGPPAVLFSCAFAGFGAAFAAACSDRRFPWRQSWARTGLLAGQAIAGIAMVHFGGDAYPGAILVIVAGQLRSVLTPPAAAAWIAVQTLALVVEAWRMANLVTALAVGGAFAGFQVFALAASSLAYSERRAREELARANAELHGTRALLAETSRVEERLRISRDLHDTLGHHLTALSLQLDVASRLAEGKAADHIRRAHAIARLMLGDVREVVGKMREGGRPDLAAAIRALAEAGGDLDIHLDVPPAFDVEDRGQAQALLRCVQEIITNAARHSGARNLWIRLEPRADGIALHARDDGRGAGQLTWGNGLIGMRERFAEYAGRVDVTTGTGRGFEVHGFMPRPEAAS